MLSKVEILRNFTVLAVVYDVMFHDHGFKAFLIFEKLSSFL